MSWWTQFRSPSGLTPISRVTSVTVLSDECTRATASRLNSAVYRLLVLLFLLTARDCFLRDCPSQYQAVQRRGGTSAGRLLAEVTKRLEQLWSPQEIAARLRLEHPADPEMRVSHETVYRSLFVQGRGELRRELARCLRFGRATRKTRGTTDGRGRIPGMTMISERPAEAEDRAVPGHWEEDLVLGEGSRSAVGTLVERSTRMTLLLHLPDGKSAKQVEAAMRKAITLLPASLARTITWDQGAEMARHAEFTTATGIPIYFCDPHSPWQRGSNENTNGLLRQYLPKGSDLSVVSRDELTAIQDSLNSRPRKTLGYLTPSEKFTALLATTG
ncbi:transposase [Streptomyces sp. Mg1]|nr:transposase [Streptomyces sp. Mg1]